MVGKPLLPYQGVLSFSTFLLAISYFYPRHSRGLPLVPPKQEAEGHFPRPLLRLFCFLVLRPAGRESVSNSENCEKRTTPYSPPYSQLRPAPRLRPWRATRFPRYQADHILNNKSPEIWNGEDAISISGTFMYHNLKLDKISITSVCSCGVNRPSGAEATRRVFPEYQNAKSMKYALFIVCVPA